MEADVSARQVDERDEVIKLSICIPTRNRAKYIGGMLESILCQPLERCEIVVLDGASTDDTELVIQQYARRCDKLRYVRQEKNGGFDQDLDLAVQAAHGQYCWLMPDDDWVKPGAVARVLEALSRACSLVIVNVALADESLSTVAVPNWLGIDQDCVCAAGDIDGLFQKFGAKLGYLGCVIIKRSIWMARERSKYYGSWFVHVGVVFQDALPEKTHVIAKPLIMVRAGNASWEQFEFEIPMIYWPSLVLSFPLSRRTKRKACVAGPWYRLGALLSGRARGRYSLAVYRESFLPRCWSYWQRVIHHLIAVLPIGVAKKLANAHSAVTRLKLKVATARVALLHSSELKQT